MQVIRNITYRTLYVLLLFCGIAKLHAQTSPRENQVKVAFLFNFTQFVDWPPASFSSAQTPLVIGVLGKDPFGSYLEETVSGEKVNNHPLVTKHYTDVEDIEDCHILFLNLDDKKKQEAILEKLKVRNVLTVSDTPDFLQQGGMIRFFTKNNKIQLQVNLEAVKAANLVISSKLLRLVEIYSAKNN